MTTAAGPRSTSWLAIPLDAVWRFLAVGLPTLAALLAVMPAVDLAYQLRAGGEILDSGAIPRVDTWTFTVAGTPWVDQQWGAQLLLTLTYRLAGWTGLALLRAGLVALTCWLLARLVSLRAPRLGSMVRTLLVLAAFTVMANALALRPQLFAIALFVLTLVLLADRSTRPRRIWAIPMIALAWANLHGSFPLVLVLLAFALLADVLDRRDPRPLSVVALASVAATGATPFGLGVWSYVVSLSTNPTISSRVSEWRPPGVTDPAGIVFWLSIVAVAAFLAFRAWRIRRTEPNASIAPQSAAKPGLVPPLHGLLMLVGFGALGAITGRGLAWWPPVVLFLIAPLIAAELAAAAGSAPASPASAAASQLQAPATPRPARRSRLNSVVIAALVFASIALLPLWRPTGPAGVPLGTLSYAPQGIASYLNASIGGATCPEGPPNCPQTGTPEGRTLVWAPQVWGSWLELSVTQVSLPWDSRIELYPGSVWEDADAIGRADPAWDSLLQKYGAILVVTQALVDQRLEAALRASPHWQILYGDADGSVWERK